MRKIELSTIESVPHKLESLKRSLETIYVARLESSSMNIPVANLYPTEDFLENDKLALVFKKIIEEDYDVPIIVVEKLGNFFVLDGHHRGYISCKIQRRMVKSIVLQFPKEKSYREVSKSNFESMPIKEVAPIHNKILLGWSRTLKILKQYEALYHMAFHMRREKILLRNLSPTEPELLKNQIDAIDRLLVPISCIRHEDRYYILDGHARCLRAKQLGLRSIEAIVLFPQIPVHFGIVETAKEMKLRTLQDIHVR